MKTVPKDPVDKLRVTAQEPQVPDLRVEMVTVLVEMASEEVEGDRDSRAGDSVADNVAVTLVQTLTQRSTPQRRSTEEAN